MPTFSGPISSATALNTCQQMHHSMWQQAHQCGSKHISNSPLCWLLLHPARCSVPLCHVMCKVRIEL